MATKQRSRVIVAHHCAVATDDQRCSEIALKILCEGGNAIDAAVTAALCLGVVSLASSGIGGGAFMLLRLANGTTKAFDMRETAPILAPEVLFHLNPTWITKGPLSIAVPGELAGLHKAWKEHGKLPWKKLVLPAADLAEGFKISDYLYKEMVMMEEGIRKDKGLSDIFIVNGSLLKAGDICRNKKLAETLRTIAEDGVETFYNGSIGKNLCQDIAELRGIVTPLDLKNYKVKMRKPISADTLGMSIIGMPPPSAGGAGIILMFNILAEYGVSLDISSSLGIHRIIEALKHVFAIRMNLGDPDYADVSEVVSDMLSLKFAKELKETINDDKTFGPSYYGGRWNEIHDYQKREFGTSHLSIVDDQGNAVAMTASVNNHFGAQILSQSTGILLNNQMDDFCMHSFDTLGRLRGNNNYIEAGKRPLSSMSPTIILENGQLIAVIGGSGGPLIIPGVSEVILNHFVKKLDEEKSVMNPRVYHQLIPNMVHYENFTSVTGDHFEVPPDNRKDLEKKGHVLASLSSGAVCQFITVKELLKGNRRTKKICAVSDSRKGGVPAGF